MRDPELLGELPDDVCRMLGIDTTTRVVMIEHATVAHIFERRSFSDAAAVMEILARKKFDPFYCGRVLADARLFFLIEPSRRVHSRAVIALKLVRSPESESGSDEIWVNTGYTVGSSTLRRMLSSNNFVVQRRTRGR